VRAAFGAGRWTLVRRSLVESALLTFTGGAVGLALAWWGIRALRPLIPANVPRAEGIGLDPQVLIFTVVVTVVAGVVFGLAPALRAMRPDVMEVLQEGGRSTTPGRATRRLSDAMVVAEVVRRSPHSQLRPAHRDRPRLPHLRRRRHARGAAARALPGAGGQEAVHRRSGGQGKKDARRHARLGRLGAADEPGGR
jgi:hypothetical protein